MTPARKSLFAVRAAIGAGAWVAALLAGGQPGLARGGSVLLPAPAVVAGVLAATEPKRAAG